MDKPEANVFQGTRARKLSHFILTKAVKYWYWGVGCEFAAIILTTTAGALSASITVQTSVAIFAFILICVAYWLKLRSEDQYDLGETVRRQSVMTESLGWPTTPLQIQHWMGQASAILNLDKLNHDPDYYDSVEEQGPKRLLECTAQSAFWTRNIYARLKVWVWLAFVLSAILLFVGLGFGFVFVEDEHTRVQMGLLIFSVALPLVVSLNFLGWALRLGRMERAICDIEKALNVLPAEPLLEEVLSLVAEYNCQVVSGFLIP